MDSGIIVYKKVVPGVDISDTIQKCFALYDDKLRAGLSSGDRESREGYQKALEIEGLLARQKVIAD